MKHRISRVCGDGRQQTRCLSTPTAILIAFSAVLPSAALARPETVQVRDLVEMRKLSGISVSPDGSLVAVGVYGASVDRDRSTVSYVVVPLNHPTDLRLIPGGAPLFDEAGVARSESVQWSPDGRGFYFRQRGADGVQVWRAEVETGQTRRITNDPADIEDFRVRRDGSIVYRTGATRAEIRAAERSAAAKGLVLDDSIIIYAPLLRTSGLHNGAWTTIRTDGTRRHPIIDNMPFRYRVLDPESASPRTVAGTTEIVELFGEPSPWDASRSIPPSPTSLAGILERLRGSETIGHETRPAASPSTVVCQSDLCAGDNFILAGKLVSGELILMRKGYADAVGLVAWNPKTGAIRSIINDGSYLTAGDRWSHRPCLIENSRAICIQTKPDLPPRLISIDLATSAIAILYEPNRALAAKRLFPARLFRWTDSQGQMYSGVLVLPEDREHKTRGHPRWPLVITSYRCHGFSQGGIGNDAPEQVLAAEGIASLCVSALPPDVDPPVLAKPYKDFTDGVRMGIAKLVGEGLVDPNRVGVSGRSFSAEAILYDISHGGHYAAASVASPTVLDPYYAGENDTGDPNSLAGLVLKYHMKYPITESDPAWAKIAPALNARSITTPLLMQVIEGEYMLGLHLYNSIWRAGGKLDVIVFPDEAHELVSPQHRLINATRNVDWFKFWLLCKEENSSQKSDRYERWNKLRE